MRATAAILAVAALVAASAASAQGPVIRRADVGRYPLVTVTALAPAGVRPELLEDGRPVSETDVENLGADNAVVLAIDNSQSMAGRPLALATRAAATFAAHAPGRVGAIAFGSAAITLAAPTGNTAALVQRLTALRPDPGTGTALFDAVSAAVRRLAPIAGARVVVVMSDGRDLGSRWSLRQVIARAERAGVVIYAIALGRADRSPLADLAQATGGTVFDAARAAALPAAYARVAADLGRVWQITYATSARPGDSVRLAVRAARQRSTMVERIPGASAPAAPVIPAGAARSGVGSVAVALLAGAAFAAALLLAVRRPRPERVRRTVSAYAGGARPSVDVRPWRRLDPLVARAERLFGGRAAWAWVARTTDRAGKAFVPAQVVGAALVAAVAAALLAAVAGISPFFGVCLVAAGFAAPFALLALLARRRLRAFDAQLPDTLATVAAALRVGHGLRQALVAVAEDGHPPISTEFRRVLTEERLGRPLDEAFVAMCERLGSPELEYVATAVTVQSQIGGSMASLFVSVAETVRERQRHARKVRALTALGRTSAAVLIALPIALAALMTLVSYDYIKPLYTTSAGHILIVLSFVSMGLGALVLSRITSVD
ncbi:MAG TPA: VWA domain-containing protein [Gaiellaceae bacterium]|nr:VWA domain-containing protein [Gaiellaceae bacterium]